MFHFEGIPRNLVGCLHCVGDVKCTPIKKCGGIVFPFFGCKDIIFVGMDGYKMLKKISLSSQKVTKSAKGN